MKVILQDVCSPKTSNLAQKDLIGRDGDYPVYGASGYIGNINFYHQANKCVAVVKDGAGIGRTMLLPEKSTAIGTMQYLIPKENILPEYLFYAVKNMHLEKYYTGATIPHIYFKDYKNEKFNYIDLEQQLCIVNTLKLVEGIISKKTKQLEQLDNLVKSLFVEMFINENYTKKKLGECAIINPKKSSDKRLHDELEVSFIPMMAVGENGQINVSKIKKFADVKNGFSYFSEGDVLFAKITPCMENGKGAIASNLCNGIGFGSTEFHVIRPIENITTSEWIYVLTTLQKFRLSAEANMTGSAGQKRVPASFLQDYSFYLPPIELQKQFSRVFKHLDKHKLLIID
ncbi:restriction endonuclease subunit S [Anaerovibrio slackiae]|uniref:restriction endonuclease subunit S n=1 Tax=Anaerovibrio slackiae TaxID=2652309 RepID=UPI00386FEDD8